MDVEGKIKEEKTGGRENCTPILTKLLPKSKMKRMEHLGESIM